MCNYLIFNKIYSKNSLVGKYAYILCSHYGYFQVFKLTNQQFVTAAIQ